MRRLTISKETFDAEETKTGFIGIEFTGGY